MRNPHLAAPYDALRRDLGGFLPRERLITDPLRPLAWGTDASFYRLVPKIVAVVEREDEVVRLLAACRIHGAEFYGALSSLKAGLCFADILTTVSPRYAREITTPGLGFGLDPILRARQKDLVGILNGVDYEEWNQRPSRMR